MKSRMPFSFLAGAGVPLVAAGTARRDRRGRLVRPAAAVDEAGATAATLLPNPTDAIATIASLLAWILLVFLAGIDMCGTLELGEGAMERPGAGYMRASGGDRVGLATATGGLSSPGVCARASHRALALRLARGRRLLLLWSEKRMKEAVA
jgi:hypothetical protein